MVSCEGLILLMLIGGAQGQNPQLTASLFSKLMNNFYRFNQPLDPATTFNNVNDMIKDFAPEENAPGCEGKLRFNGDCIIENVIPARFEKCQADCYYDESLQRCRCRRKVESRWVCPESLTDVKPIDFVVSLFRKSDPQFDVRPLNEGDDKRKMPKSVKVVKMCLHFDVGLADPICDESFPIYENDTCLREIQSAPLIPCNRLLRRYDDLSVTIEDVEYECTKTIEWRRKQELTCSCRWREISSPAFKCPEPFSRSDGIGDYYTIDQMRNLSETMSREEFPMKLCHAREYIPIQCSQALLKKKTSALISRPHISFGEWSTVGSTCVRDIWYPPSEPFCRKEGDEFIATNEDLMNRGTCTRFEKEDSTGRCAYKSLEMEFNERSQNCSMIEYSKPVSYSCDRVFNRPVEDWGVTPIVQKDQDGQTCSVTRYIPALNECAKKDCYEEIYEIPEPICSEGKLTGKGDSSRCVVKTLKRKDYRDKW